MTERFLCARHRSRAPHCLALAFSQPRVQQAALEPLIADKEQGTPSSEHFSSVPLEMFVPGSLVGTWNASAKSRESCPWVVCILVGWQVGQDYAKL